MAQIFIGLNSHVVDVYGMHNEDQFVDTLQDQIRTRGAMDKLISDRATTQISARVADILRAWCIAAWQSEPYHEHQNPAERTYQNVKRKTNQVLDWTGSPAYLWLLAMRYVCFILNHLSSPHLNGLNPLTYLTGQVTDISPLFLFIFNEPVFFASEEKLAYNKKVGFPS